MVLNKFEPTYLHQGQGEAIKQKVARDGLMIGLIHNAKQRGEYY